MLKTLFFLIVAIVVSGICYLNSTTQSDFVRTCMPLAAFVVGAAGLLLFALIFGRDADGKNGGGKR